MTRVSGGRRPISPPIAALSAGRLFSTTEFSGCYVIASTTARRAAAKRDAIPCDNHPDAIGTIRHGTAVSTWQKIIACPKAVPNRRLHQYADPVSAEGHCTGARSNIFSFPPGAAHFLFDVSKRKWGAHLPAIIMAAFPRSNGRPYNCISSFFK